LHRADEFDIREDVACRNTAVGLRQEIKRDSRRGGFVADDVEACTAIETVRVCTFDKYVFVVGALDGFDAVERVAGS
jgi:hypothetical protein